MAGKIYGIRGLKLVPLDLRHDSMALAARCPNTSSVGQVRVSCVIEHDVSAIVKRWLVQGGPDVNNSVKLKTHHLVAA